jgi:uncharacterized protein YidB (DUF937 family)
MSLLKTLAGAVLSGAGGQAGLAAIVMQNPKLMQATMGLLSKDSPIGGLPGLVSNFQSAGLGAAVASWLGAGPNQPVSGEEVQAALGASVIDQLAAQARMTPAEASAALSTALPAMIDKLTPKGAAGALDMGQVQSLLGGFLKGRL